MERTEVYRRIDGWAKITWLHEEIQNSCVSVQVNRRQVSRCVWQSGAWDKEASLRTCGGQMERWQEGEGQNNQAGAVTVGAADRDHIHVPHSAQCNFNVIHKSAASCYVLHISFCRTWQTTVPQGQRSIWTACAHEGAAGKMVQVWMDVKASLLPAVLRAGCWWRCKSGSIANRCHCDSGAVQREPCGWF